MKPYGDPSSRSGGLRLKWVLVALALGVLAWAVYAKMCHLWSGHRETRMRVLVPPSEYERAKSVAYPLAGHYRIP